MKQAIVREVSSFFLAGTNTCCYFLLPAPEDRARLGSNPSAEAGDDTDGEAATENWWRLSFTIHPAVPQSDKSQRVWGPASPKKSRSKLNPFI